uniref:ATP-dependent clp protease ATP binding subunit n=1 Tax=Heterosigma akashiwo TaxID=2829 RepID=A0A224AES4_HETAK|nr:ATP-dependent clp protease ATP binding subunit [Heterosigma akashiwo]BBA18356.1 ATP-dependent clp protease ATP binding subunit [Heterosigma akashiwo]BBA18495.1 ATP-dependent clp protease ATP binding subunit [Heterosigma akashiwo]BBA18633.1 ATP-dependent clp protease ATP binding subunit [Heterosigma akashiwo]BBA18772.1 ATP-dependent clp protease ATP binding subunit [Heterosigma akashiwo]
MSSNSFTKKSRKSSVSNRALNCSLISSLISCFFTSVSLKIASRSKSGILALMRRLKSSIFALRSDSSSAACAALFLSFSIIS